MFFTMKNYRLKIIIAIALIAFGVIGRLVRISFFPELYNVEPITAASLLAGALLGGGYALIVPLSIVAVSDMVIGNTPIMMFTWSAWAVTGLMGLILRKRKTPTALFALKLTGMGMASSVFFFLWTNFGVWLMDGIYSPTIDGLMRSYYMGLPFFRNNVFSNLIIVPLASLAAIMVWQTVVMYKKKKKLAGVAVTR